KRWVEQVKNVRELARDAVEGRLTPEHLADKSLLKNFAAKVELLQHLDRAHWSRIGEVKVRPDAYGFDKDGNKVPSPHVSVEVDGRRHRVDGAKTIDEAMDQVKALLDQAAPDKRLQFEIRGNRKLDHYFINKKGDKEYRKLKEFDSLDDARTYLKDHHNDLVDAWEAVKDRDNVTKGDMRRRANRERVGPDYRNGEDVTPEQFSEQFGFRGVEFGNWVRQGKNARERQGMLNQTYDALMDLADILGVPPRALSLDGTLGLGLGSRGHGWASAHFEPDRLVINLTKTRGAGSLAHEWLHSLDNYFARKRGTPDIKSGQDAYRRGAFITYRPENYYVLKQGGHGITIPESAFDRMMAGETVPGHGRILKAYRDPSLWRKVDGVRPEVGKAFAELVAALDNSPMKARAERIDKGNVDGYWSRIIERAARSFENYIITKMADKGIENDYLANVTSPAEFKRAAERYPYLKPDEVGPVAKAFDTLFNTIETRETEKGNVALYASRDRSGQTPGLSVSDAIKRITNRIGAKALKRLTDAKTGFVHIVQHQDELPPHLQAKGAIGGVTDPVTGEVWLVADRMEPRSADFDPYGLFLHELGVHSGLRGLLGDKADDVLAQVREGAKKKASRLYQARQRVPGSTTKEHVDEETLAYFIGDPKNHNTSLARRIFAAVRATLYRMGIVKKLSDDDLAAIVRASLRKATREAGRRAPDYGELAPSYARHVHTREQYEQRIDELFDGAKPNAEGVRALDEGDVLTLTGYGDMPVVINEGHAIGAGKYNHPLPKWAWQKMPEWIDNPAAVFERTKDGHLTMIGPELVDGHAVIIGLEPNAPPPHRSGGEARHLVLTAFEKDRGTLPLGRMVEDGDMKPLYIDQKKGPQFYAGSGVSFPGRAAELRAFNRKIKTDRDLVKFRRARSAASGSKQPSFAKSERAAKSPVLKGLQLPNSVSGASGSSRSILTEADVLSRFPEGDRAAFGLHRNTDGTLKVTGDRAAIRDALKAAGIDTKGIPARDGLIFGKSRAEAVENALNGPAPKFAVRGEDFEGSMPEEAEHERAIPRQGSLTGSHFEVPEDTLTDQLLQAFQDRYIDAKRVQDAIEAGRPISDALNFYQKEELYHGRAEEAMRMAEEYYVKPLLDQVKTAGLTLDEASDFVKARHAKERNARIAKINPAFKSGEGSGMTDAEADAILAQYRDNPAVQKIGTLFDRMAQIDRNLLVETGLETPETVAGWEAMYKHYAPAKGAPEGKAERKGNGSGKGLQVGGKVKRAFGRRSPAGNAIVHLLRDHQQHLIDAERAEPGRALIRLAEDNPNPDFWEVDAVEYRPSIDKETGLVKYTPTHVGGDNTFTVPIDGVPHRLTLHTERGERLAKALKNLNGEADNLVIRGLSHVNRYLAMVNTGLNPEFVLSNFLRDLQEASINLTDTQAADVRGRVVRDTPRAVRGAWRALNGKVDTQWAQYFDEFRKAGGKTGWAGAYRDVDVLAKRLEGQMRHYQRGAKHPLKLARNLADLIENANSAVENGVRLSAFVHAREAGASVEQAASLAKNLTVNFNRKGQYGSLMNSLYLFFNASMQGSARVARLLASPKGRKVALALTATAVAINLYDRLAGGEDDAGMPYYDQIPDYIKERNVIIMLPGTDGDYVSVPMPWGYSVFGTVGNQIGWAASDAFGWTPKHYDAMDSAAAVMSSFANAFNPIGGESSLVQFLSPTVTDPIAQVASNQTWYGGNLMPEPNPFTNTPKPDSERYYQSAPEWAKQLAASVNAATGGTKVEPGEISVSPETLSMLFDTVTGGVGRFFERGGDVATKITIGAPWEPREMPFLRKVYGQVGDASVRDAYYTNLRKIGYAKANMDYAKKMGDAGLRQRMLQERAAYVRAQPFAAQIQKQIRDLKDQLDRIERSNTGLSVKRIRRQAVNKRIVELMRRLNQQVEKMKR
ncbi:MAG TPA: LPD38 domain-containing protein, partial [Gammaproteobacteria bacterium]|nr:LPD38 domain-containing protein [Gammaproteobacteria bacterium]